MCALLDCDNVLRQRQDCNDVLRQRQASFAAEVDAQGLAYRAQERRPDITEVLQRLDTIRRRSGVSKSKGPQSATLDMTSAEGKGQYLEGTGAPSCCFALVSL